MRTKLTIILFLISACGVYAQHKSSGTPAEVVSPSKKTLPVVGPIKQLILLKREILI